MNRAAADMISELMNKLAEQGFVPSEITAAAATQAGGVKV
jgi:hypothetical protein